MLKSKIHRATVTGAEINYPGSITIDGTLLGEARILPYEQVAVYNISNGVRFETYAVKGPPDSGTICINGAAARLAQVGDIVIIASYALLDDHDLYAWKPAIVLVDDKNKPLADK
jgi:aspartate 1-decarboxylase